jgi:hypothetical protein
MTFYECRNVAVNTAPGDIAFFAEEVDALGEFIH